MAFYSVLRRASSSLLPLAFRSVGSSRAYHGVISSVLAVGKRQLRQDLSPGSFFPSPRFSTATDSELSSDDSLIRVLQSEIECAEGDDLPVNEIPDVFPFEIEDNPGERTISLKRKYQDEVIKVEVDIPTVAAGENEDEQAGDNDEEKSEESIIPLVVSVSKGSGVTLEFGVTAFPDEISIDSLSIKHSEESKDQLLYEGPEFHDLDENLQKAFHKYLEIRGIKPSTTNFLHEYMISKDRKEYLMWLKNLKSFVEK